VALDCGSAPYDASNSAACLLARCRRRANRLPHCARLTLGDLQLRGDLVIVGSSVHAFCNAVFLSSLYSGAHQACSSFLLFSFVFV
jgi:hypothetical protein